MNEASGWYSRKRRRQKVERRLNLVVVIFMFFSLLATTLGPVQPVTAAQDGSEDCPRGQVLNRSGECVDEEGDGGDNNIEVIGDLKLVQVDSEDDGSEDDGSGDRTDGGAEDDGSGDRTDGDSDDATDDGGDGSEDATDDGGDDYADLDIDETATVEFNKWECPADFQPSDPGNQNEYVNTCQQYPMSGVDFQVWDDNSNQVGSETSGSQGYVGFELLSPGWHGFQENIPDGYGEPVVFCSYSPYEGNNQQLAMMVESGTFWFELKAYDYLYCDVYNMAEQQEEYRVWLYKWNCDEYYDPEQYNEYDWYQQNCTKEGDQGWLFYANQYEKALSNSDNFVWWEEFDYGNVDFYEPGSQTGPAPAVFCWNQVRGDTPNPEMTQVDPVQDGYAWSYDWEQGNHLICHVYDYETPNVAFFKWYCDVYMDPQQYMLEDFLNSCTGNIPGTELSVNGETKTLEDNNQAAWNVEYGEIQAQETAMQGYGQPAIFCWSGDPADYFDDGELVIPDSDNGYWNWTWDLAEDEALFCNIFNQPEEDYGDRVYLYKWNCDEYFDPSQYDYDWYQQNCITEGDQGTNFRMNGVEKALSNGDNFVWLDGADLQYGTINFYEGLGDGYGAPVVFCWIDGVDSPEMKNVVVGSDSAQWSDEWTQGYNLICHVFNMPPSEEDYGDRVYLYKWVCDQYYDPSQYDYDWYQQNCMTEGEQGWLFYANGEEKALSNSDNFVWWEDLPYGDITFSEPNTYSMNAPVVFCWHQENSGVIDMPSVSVDGDGYTWDYDFEEGYNLICHVFNDGQYQGDDGFVDVDLNKWECPEGWMPSNPDDQNEYVNNCQQYPMQDVDFNVYDVNSNLLADGTTDAGGYLGFADLPGGYLFLQEEIPAGYGQPVVFCSYAEVAGEGATQHKPTVTDGMWGFEWEFPDNSYLYCDVYNFHEDQPEERITLYKWVCDDYYDPTDGWDYQYYSDNCTTEGEQGWLFYANGEEKALSNGDNLVWWEDFDYGMVQFTEPAEYSASAPVVFCWRYEVTGAVSGPELIPVSMGANGYEWVYEHQEGYGIICHVFNEYQDNDGYIEAWKYLCPPGLTFAVTPTLDNLLTACSTPGEGFDFAMIDANGNNMGDSDDTGHVVWPDYEPGNISIAEILAPGFDLYAVWCGVKNVEDPGEIGYFEWTNVTGTTADLGEIFEGHIVSCYFFNTWEGGAVVELNKWECPVGWTPTDPDLQNEWVLNCQPYGMEGVTFEVLPIGDDTPMATGTTDSSGYVSIPGVAAGQDVYIREVVPSGYYPGSVWCTWESGDGAAGAEEHELEGDRFGVSIPSGSAPYLHCDVYNMHDGWDVTLYKFYCEQYYDPSMYDLNWYINSCPQTHGGATFELNGDPKAISNSDNFVWWDDVPTGDATFYEYEESGYGSPIVYCWYVTENGGQAAQLMDVSEARTWIMSVEEGARIVCYVFNPPQEDDIVVIKYICPYGYDYEHASLEDLRLWCEVIEIPIPFTLYGGNDLLETQNTGDVMPGGVVFNGYSDYQGQYAIYEDKPAEYGEPVVYCRAYTEFDGMEQSTLWSEMPVSDNRVELDEGFVGAEENWLPSWYCYWFNFQGDDYDNTITVRKWECPPWNPGEWEDTLEWLLNHCTLVMENIDFTLDDANGVRTKSTDGSGMVVFDDAAMGPFSLSEDIPPGFGWPIFYCGWTAFYNGAVYDAFPMKHDSPGGTLYDSITIPNTDYFCDVFNIPEQPGQVVFWKYWCPEGYDINGWGANPWDDCKQPGEGITFDLDGDAKQTDANGYVSWGDLDPGTYTVTETYPGGIDYSFILKCFGGQFPGIQPWPLQYGNQINIDVAPGDYIECYVFNVPLPDDGWIVVYKYWCSTKTFEHVVDCDTYEGGMTFQLHTYPGDDFVNQKVTDVYGKTTFNGLSEGDYTLTEVGYNWCAIDISNKGPEGSVKVEAGKETVVKVYNCDTPEKKKPPYKPPTKYPNTGVDPGSFVTSLPSAGTGSIAGTSWMQIALLAMAAAIVAIAGGVTLLRHRRNTRSESAGSVVTTRRVFIGSAIGALVAPLAVSAQPTIEPLDVPDDEDDASAEGTPEFEFCVPGATPEPAGEGTPEPDDCVRGQVPKHIRVEAIGVDADIEIQEIIAGALQDPTGPELVTWYKETSRLGELGNGVYAGHLNYWGIPEAVFFGLRQLQPGDEVILTGENDEEFVYRVQWVRAEPGQEEPNEEVLGLTEEEAITLITCGGEWDTSIAEYNQRTTVRAVRQPEEDEESEG